MLLRSWFNFRNGQSKRSWWPLLVTGTLLILLALAWLPMGDLLPEQRSNKPQLVVNYLSLATDPRFSELQTELNQRLQSRHEWRLREVSTDYAWQVSIGFETTVDTTVLIAELRAPANLEVAAGREIQRIRVQAPNEAALVLPEQLVKVLTEKVETGENQANDL
ncbi:hypothetical protein CWE22_00310 [Pseudidiomarina aestuarii]|uniref:Uncharacterized protein n=1 Tax=Pseudidiomarina aestuarii TaxID=624146 RepID=A0A7Z6ZSR2_9GAMM|nr:hypothetical protein [Pseudidiomarina aestuarii]RUO40692.1 hypothetical protein CWE22_00310 [Pseudidiomarina aestuarii]